MKLCKKHLAFIERRIKDIEPSDQKEILLNFIEQLDPLEQQEILSNFIDQMLPSVKQEILSKFIDKMLPSRGIEHIQDRIENTKSHCPVCFYKLPGNDKLREIIISISKKTKILV